MDVNDLKPKVALALFQKLVDKLDDLDEEDYFGTEGWKHFFGIED